MKAWLSIDKRLFLKALFAASIAVAVASTAFAEEKKLSYEETYSAAKQFASCAGLFEAMRDYGTMPSPSDAMVKYTNGLAKGAMLVSQHFARRVLEEEKAIAFSENLRATFAEHWRLQIEGGVDHKYKDELWKCHWFSLVQASRIEEIFKKVSGFK